MNNLPVFRVESSVTEFQMKETKLMIQSNDNQMSRMASDDMRDDLFREG